MRKGAYYVLETQGSRDVYVNVTKKTFQGSCLMTEVDDGNTMIELYCSIERPHRYELLVNMTSPAVCTVKFFRGAQGVRLGSIVKPSVLDKLLWCSDG